MKLKITSLCAFSLMIGLNACAPKRDLVYFSNMTSQFAEKSIPAPDILIHKNDVLNITLTSKNPESNLLFASNRNQSQGVSGGVEGYRVNGNGNIVLPFVGEFKIEGMSIEEANANIASQLTQYVKDPVVDVQITNFKITVIGEVNKPSTFIIPDGKVNVLEALGLAGDMTVYGKRENVLILRTENNHKTIKKLNLNNEETLNSPYFYLKQNDIVYVEPDRSKAVEYSQNTRLMPVVIASISAIAVVMAVILKR